MGGAPIETINYNVAVEAHLVQDYPNEVLLSSTACTHTHDPASIYMQQLIAIAVMLNSCFNLGRKSSMKRSRLLMVFSVVLTLALLATPAFAADPNPGSGSADVTVMNADTNTGGAASTVLAQYYSQAGTLSNTRAAERGPARFLSVPSVDSGLPDNWVGAMVLGQH